MKEKLFLSAIAIAVTGMLSAATLNVELTVSHGIESTGGAGAKSRRVAYFVVDRSGSMDDESLDGGRKPNDALLESMKLRLDALPDGTSVFVIPFASTIKSIKSYPSLDAKQRMQIMQFVKNDRPNGCTLLYDAQDLALTEAARMMRRDPGAEVSVYVYTDGRQETPYDYKGEYPARTQIRKKFGSRFKWQDNPDYVQEKDAACAKFRAKFGDMVSKPNLEIEYEWLSRSPKPDTSDWGSKPRLGTALSSSLAALKNPQAEPEQTVKCHLFLPITDGCWEEVKGKKASLDFDVEGRRISAAIDLCDGMKLCKLDWPAFPDEKPAVASLSLSRLPGGRKFDLKDPKPIVLSVPPVGRTSVSVENPAKGAVVSADDTVEFKAKASEGANVRWIIGGETLTGMSVNWKAKSSGSVEYRVTASRAGFKDSEVKGTLEVIPTGVKIDCETDRHEVGKESVFRAKAIGPCRSYAWTVDGSRVPGETATLKYVFEKSGRHQVGVTAMYKAGIAKDAERIETSVSAAPFIEILSPIAYDGEAEGAQYQAEKPIDLLARIEGDLTSVTWQFKLKDKSSTIQTVVDGGKSSGSHTPAKGGFYDVTVTAKGPAGEKSQSTQIFVKSTEIQVAIDSPRANQHMETGKEFDLSATVKGPVKSVRWKMVDNATAKVVSFGPSDVSAVVDGKASIKANLPLELGNTGVEITAEPELVDEELRETVQPSSITIEAVTLASISYTSETLRENWKRVKFGNQVALGVEVSGAIKKVAWFTCDLDGKERKLEKEGLSINIDVPTVRGQRECHADYIAKGLMPDGSWLSADQPLTIVACCPCRLAGEGCGPKIELPKTNGITRTSYGLKEPVQAEVGSSVDYELVDVAWDMGDKTKYAAKVANHPGYDAYGKYVISATGKCKVCGCDVSLSPVEVVVEPQPITAEFAIRPFASSTTTIAGRVSQGRQVVLVGMDSPDIARREWTCNGVLLKDEKGNPMSGSEIEFRCMDVGDVEFGLTVFDTKGNAVGPVTHKLRVYRLWVVVIAFLAALLVAGLYWWYFSGDDPRFWKVFVRVDETNSMDAQSVEADMASGPGLVRYWDTMRNRATIPLSKLGGKQSEDWGAGTVLGQTSLMIWESSTAADGRGVRMPNCSLLNPPDGMEKESLSKGQLIHIWAPSPSDPKAVTALWVKIKMRAAPNTFLWLRFGILLLCLGLAVAISYFFAF